MILKGSLLTSNEMVSIQMKVSPLPSFSLSSGKWQHVKDTTEINEGKLFSPGNLRATFDNPDYNKVLLIT